MPGASASTGLGPSVHRILQPFITLVVLTATAHMSFSIVRLAVVLYAVQLEASAATVGILMAIFGLLGALFSVQTGRWIDRVGPRTPMMIGLSAMIAGPVLAFYWRDLAALFVVSAVVGTLFNLYFIAYQPLIGRYGRPEDRIRNFSIASVGISISGLISPILTGFSIDHVGYAETFLLAALLPVIPLAVIALNRLHFPAVVTRQGGTNSSGVGGFATKSQSTLVLFRHPRLRRIYLFALLIHITWSLYNFLMPLYCLEVGLNASSIGIVLGAYALTSIASRALATPLSRRFSPWQLLIVSSVVAGVCFAGFVVATSFVALTVLSAVLGLGMGMANPTSQALLYDAAPPERVGEVMGLRITMGNVVQTVVPLVSGAIGAAMGMGPVFFVLALVQCYASWDVRTLWRRTGGRPDGTSG